MVILGSTHTGSLGRVRPGTTAERLLSGSPCAVAVAPHGYRTLAAGSPKRIGLAWNSTQEARTALAAAVCAARAWISVVRVAMTSTYRRLHSGKRVRMSQRRRVNRT